MIPGNNVMDIQFIKTPGTKLPRFVYRYFRFEKGQGMVGHTHTVDHPTLVVKGAVRITYESPRDNGEGIVKAPDHIIVPADAKHTVIAEEDDSIWLCVFELPEGYSDDQAFFWEAADLHERIKG